MSAATVKSEGQKLVDALVAFLRSWIVFRHDHDALVCALWVLNTYVFRSFDTCPYLCISAATKQAGKTALLESCAALSMNSEILTDPHAANLMRMAEQEEYGGMISFFIDEAEKLNKEANDARQYLNTGYREGGSIPRTMPGGKTIKFPTYGPKAFALIGDVYDTLRDRCIVVRLVRSSTVTRRYRPSFMRAEAKELTFKIRDLMERYRGGVPWADDSLAGHLQGRNEEIWLPIFSVAAALELDPATMLTLTKASTDMSAEKTDEARSYIELRATAEAKATEDDYAERALRDLRAVIAQGETAVWSAVAVERMREIPTAPWRTFKGTGLNEIVLASLLSRFGLNPVQINKKAGGKQINQRGYKLAAVENAARELGK